MVGFLQYIAPTISLILGVFVFGEHFTSTHMIAFFLYMGCISCILGSENKVLSAETTEIYKK